METEFIYIEDFCNSHNITETFILELQEYELVDLKLVDDQQCIYVEELPKVEKLVRLHRDLDINLEGLEAIHHLLEKTIQLQNEIHTLKKRLSRYRDI